MQAVEFQSEPLFRKIVHLYSLTPFVVQRSAKRSHFKGFISQTPFYVRAADKLILDH